MNSTPTLAKYIHIPVKHGHFPIHIDTIVRIESCLNHTKIIFKSPNLFGHSYKVLYGITTDISGNLSINTSMHYKELIDIIKKVNDTYR